MTSTEIKPKSPGSGVPVTGVVLRWARDESGYSLEEVAAKLGVEESVILEWEDEAAKPSKGQVTKLAEMYKRQKAVFFLPKAPASTLPPNFRKAPGLGDRALNPKELLNIRIASRLQDIVSWILEDKGEGTPFKHFSLDKDPEKAANSMREWLNISVNEQIDWKTPKQAFEHWRSGIEELGIIVLQQSIGKNNIRGFSYKDNFTPMAVVNTSYNMQARIFTLFHEIGHIFTETETVCWKYFSPPTAGQYLQPGDERWCDQFSAAFLMPEIEFFEQAEKHSITVENPTDDIKKARQLANKFKVSVGAASLRLQKLGLAMPNFYNQVFGTLKELDLPEKGGGGIGIPIAERTLSKLGHRPIEMLFDAHRRKRITTLDLADFLDIRTDKIEDLKNLL